MSLRRLLTDQHPQTAGAYNTVASPQRSGQVRGGQPLYEKAKTEIQRRLLTDDHPDGGHLWLPGDDLERTQAKQCPCPAAPPKRPSRSSAACSTTTPSPPATPTSRVTWAPREVRAQPLLEKALEIRRRLLTDDSPQTANSYNNLAINLDNQGQFGLAQPMLERATEIHRRRSPQPPTPPIPTTTWRTISMPGKFAQAQPLYEKSLGKSTDACSPMNIPTGRSYNNLAMNLTAQGKHTQAQPLLEKALDIERRLLTDDHPDTAKCLHFSGGEPQSAAEVRTSPAAVGEGSRYRAPDCSRTTTLKPPSAITAWLRAFMTRGTIPWPNLCSEALEIRRRRLTGNDHTLTSTSYNNLALQPGTARKVCGGTAPVREGGSRSTVDFSPTNTHIPNANYGNFGANLNAQGKYHEARDQWRRGVRSMDTIRLRVPFTGLERPATWVPCASRWPPFMPGSDSPPRHGRRRGRPRPRSARRPGRGRTAGLHLVSEPAFAN